MPRRRAEPSFLKEQDMRNINVQGNAFCYAGPVGSGRGGSRKIPDGFSGASPPCCADSAVSAMSCADGNCHADHQPGRTKKILLVAAIIALVLGALSLTGCPQPTGPSTGGNTPTPGGGGDGETYEGHTEFIDGVINFAEIRKNGWDDSKAYLEAQKALDCLTDQSNAIKTAYANWNPSSNPEKTLRTNIITFQGHMANNPTLIHAQAAATPALKEAISNLHMFTGGNNITYADKFFAFLLGNKIQQRCNYNSQWEDGGMTYRAEFASKCSELGIQNPENIGAAIAAIRSQLEAQLATAGPSDAPAQLIQQIADIGKLDGWMEDLNALEISLEKPQQAQAANKSNVKLAFPEPQAQPKLTRAEIQAQHGIVNSEELLHG
jgi:hypothetical protein